MRNFNVAILGATGLVGEEAIQIIHDRGWNLERIALYASARSKGKPFTIGSRTVTVQDIQEVVNPFEGFDVALFSAGSAVSKLWAPQAVSQGCWVVDNSSAFRMEPDIALVTMPVNGFRIGELKKKGRAHIVANPNCSTIQLVWPLKALHDAFGLEDVIVSSYQAVSGAGGTVLKSFMGETKALLDQYWSGPTHHFPSDSLDKYGLNVIPRIGDFNHEGYSQEEWKIIQETKKILGLPGLSVSATAVRVPIANGHSESVTVTLSREASLEAVKEALANFEGINFYDTLKAGTYPTPRMLTGQDTVGVGRLRKDPHHLRRFHLWVVADNLRVGAASNALDIMEAVVGL